MPERLRPQHIETVSTNTAQEIVRNTRFTGLEEMDQSLVKTLVLPENGLLPKYKVEAYGLSFWFTPAYLSSDEHLGVIGFVGNDPGETVARYFYLSRSHCVWRYLPYYYYKDEEEGEESMRLGKGYNEQSVTLPVDLQEALAHISTGHKATRANPLLENMFLKTAKKYDDTIPDRLYQNREEHEEWVKNPDRPFQLQPEDLDYVHDVSLFSDKLKGNFYPEGEVKKVPPEAVDFFQWDEDYKNQAPDFIRRVKRWQQKSPLHGTIEVEVFPSKDNCYHYMFCSNSRGKAWIGGVETSLVSSEGYARLQKGVQIGTTGLRYDWVDAGSLVTPAYEYEEQTDGYGNEDDRLGPYVDTFSNYLSEIPVIQEYLRLVGKTFQGRLLTVKRALREALYKRE